MPGGAEGSHCSANEPANVSGHGSASQQSDSVVNALKVTLLLWSSPCQTSCLSLNSCVLSWQHPRGHHWDVTVMSGVVLSVTHCICGLCVSWQGPALTAVLIPAAAALCVTLGVFL